MDHLTYRLATLADLDSLVTLRAAFIAEVSEQPVTSPELIPALRSYFARALPAGEFVAYVAVVRGRIVATSGLVFHRSPPTPWNLEGLTGYIMNMYTLPAWRRHGLATTLMQLLLSYASKQNCQRITLHAMHGARHLYTGIGFLPREDEMVIDLCDINVGG